MPDMTPHYHYGYRKIFPFAQYGDTQTAWMQKRYQIKQKDYAERPLIATLLSKNDVSMTENPAIAEAEPWLVKVEPKILFPGTLQVTETYGYLPQQHDYPGQIQWEIPGWEIGAGPGYMYISNASNLPNGGMYVYCINNDSTLSIDVGDRVRLSRPQTTQLFYTRYGLVSPELPILESVADPTRAGVTRIRVPSFSFTTSVGGTVPGLAGDLLSNPVGFKSYVTAGSVVRYPETRLLGCIYRREYFRYTPPSYQRFFDNEGGEGEAIVTDNAQAPQIVEAFRILSVERFVTSTLGEFTSPTVEEYRTLIDNRAPVVAEYSRLEQIAGDIWCRETPYVTAL